MAEIVLVNPRFELSYWGLEHALGLVGKRATMPPAALALLAALTPRGHVVSIADENVAPLDFARLARADVVGVTGMSVQRLRQREILGELRRRGTFVVAGGPWASVSEDDVADLAHTVFVGEADETWPRFLADWREGRPLRRYEQAERTDMTTLPAPRLELLDLRRYLFGSVQFSRGCPFQCEFCDIIVTFGRRARLKTAAQVVAELELLRRHGVAIVFVVDDNFVGDKRAVKPLLAAVADWQERHGFPLLLATEASLDLAEDDELLRSMVAANFASVFVGIESPDPAALRETRKFQNLGGGASLVERVRRIQSAGLEVWCGLIVGFDHDDAAIFAAQERFVHEAGIPQAMPGMLSAIPRTPLHARLLREGRLAPPEEDGCGTNVVPAKMTRRELRDGYVKLFGELYAPAAYFDRLDALFVRGGFEVAPGLRRYWRRHPVRRATAQVSWLLKAGWLRRRLLRTVPDAELRRTYRRRLADAWRARHDPLLLFGYALRCAMHYHHHRMARDMAERRSAVVNTY